MNLFADIRELVVAELQARTYHESQDKPIYAIREILESRPSTAEVPAELTR